MNRREFIGTAALAAAGGLTSVAEESGGVAEVNTYPVLSGPEFNGLEGAIAPIFTPYRKDGAVDGDMVGRMVEFLIGKGISGFYVGGGTGEHVLLSVDERKYLAESVIGAVAGRAKVIVHVGCTYTEDSVALAKHAEKAGADWIASLGPLVFGQNFDASCYHYGRIAGATSLPMMVYCWYRELDPERERKFFDIPNVKGLKYTGNNFWAVQELKRTLDKEAVFFVGDDPHLLGGLTMNGVFSGGIGTTFNVIPESFVRICRLAKSGRFVEASPVQDAANRIVKLLSRSSNFSYRKLAMKHWGFDCGFARSPFGRPLTDGESTAFLRELNAALGELG
jgi:N-acetylneuraminate lyase